MDSKDPDRSELNVRDGRSERGKAFGGDRVKLGNEIVQLRSGRHGAPSWEASFKKVRMNRALIARLLRR